MLPDNAGPEFLRFISSKQLHTPVGLKRFCVSMPEENLLRLASNPSPWVAATHYMPNLRRVYISCGTATTFTATLPDTLDLKSIELPRCCLGSGLVALLPAIRSYRSLSMISLANNRLSHSELLQLLAALRMTPNLRMLNLSYNDFGDRGVQAIINEPLARSLDALSTFCS